MQSLKSIRPAEVDHFFKQSFEQKKKLIPLYGRSQLYASAQGRHETGGVLSLFSSLSFDISIKNSMQRWASDFQGLFCVKIRKMAQGSKEVRGSFAILFWLPCATWHRVMTHTHHTQPFRSTDAFLRHSTPGPIAEVSWGFLLHPPVDFLSVSRHDARAPLERTKDVDFKRVQLLTEWCLKARNGSGGNVDDVDRSTSRRVGAWSIFWTSPELFSAVVSVIFPFLCWWTWRMSSRSFTTEEVDSSTRLLLEQTTSTLVSAFTIS